MNRVVRSFSTKKLRTIKDEYIPKGASTAWIKRAALEAGALEVPTHSIVSNPYSFSQMPSPLVQDDWGSNPRWKGIIRPYSGMDIVRLRGSFKKVPLSLLPILVFIHSHSHHRHRHTPCAGPHVRPARRGEAVEAGQQ